MIVSCWSVEVQLKLTAARPESCPPATDLNNLPFLALQHAPEFVVENLTVGRRYLEAESIITGPHNLASDLEARTSNEMGQ
jgi:hypothetical protein